MNITAYMLAKHHYPILAVMAALMMTASCVKVNPEIPEEPSEKPDPMPEPQPEPEPEPDPGKKKDADWKEFKKVAKFPVVRITAGQTIQKDIYTTGSITFEDPDGMYCDVPSLSGTMQIKGRGNTTWNQPKKPYRIKLDEKSKVLGMKANSDWVLLANYCDKSMLRNQAAMEISRIADLDWTPHCRTVELYLNGSYQGMYDLFQKVEVAGEKVDLQIATDADNSGEALTGDYFLEIDTTQDEPVSFTTPTYLVPLMFKEPEYPTAQQEKYIKDYFAQVDKAMAAEDIAKVGEYLDLDSFVKFFIVQELTKNVDGGLRKSSFMSKRRGGKAEISCVWDFDLSLGNANYLTDKSLCNGKNGDNGPEGWWVRYYQRTGTKDCWYSILMRNAQFNAQLKAKWNELKPELDKVPEMIDALTELYGDAITRNYNQWRTLGTNVWPNVVYPKTYKEEIDYLKNFYTTRLAWLDREINAL